MFHHWNLKKSFFSKTRGKFEIQMCQPFWLNVPFLWGSGRGARARLGHLSSIVVANVSLHFNFCGSFSMSICVRKASTKIEMKTFRACLSQAMWHRKMSPKIIHSNFCGNFSHQVENEKFPQKLEWRPSGRKVSSEIGASTLIFAETFRYQLDAKSFRKN